MVKGEKITQINSSSTFPFNSRFSRVFPSEIPHCSVKRNSTFLSTQELSVRRDIQWLTEMAFTFTFIERRFVLIWCLKTTDEFDRLVATGGDSTEDQKEAQFLFGSSDFFPIKVKTRVMQCLTFADGGRDCEQRRLRKKDYHCVQECRREDQTRLRVTSDIDTLEILWKMIVMPGIGYLLVGLQWKKMRKENWSQWLSTCVKRKQIVDQRWDRVRTCCSGTTGHWNRTERFHLDNWKRHTFLWLGFRDEWKSRFYSRS